jgi:hypothetical protein
MAAALRELATKVVPSRVERASRPRAVPVAEPRPQTPKSDPNAVPGEPRVRARFLQEWLAAMEEEPARQRSRFFAALPADARSTIEASARTSWLPVGLHVLLADLTLAALGPASAHDYYRRAMSKSLQGPLLGPAVRTATRLLGLTPGTFVRWAPRAWETGFRDCGALVGEVTAPGRGRLLYQDLPDVCLASDAWLDSAQGSAYGVLDLAGASGVARIDKSRLDERLLIVHIEWTVTP